MYSPISLTNVRDNNDRRAVGARVYFYVAGTTTPRPIYQNEGLTVAHTNPIVLGSTGRVPPVYTSGAAYRVRIETSGGTLIEDIDNIAAELPVSGGGGGGGATFPTGFVAPMLMSSPLSGWVRLNGRSIGAAGSSATELASADALALFTLLWTSVPGLPVSGGRGISATADWEAGKTIQLPDARGRTLAGLAGMGNTTLTLLDTVAWLNQGAASATSNTLAAYGGAGSVTLTTAQIPSHMHSGTTDSSGAHVHTGTTDAAGAHAHGGETGNAGEHAHTATCGSAGAHQHTGSTTDIQGEHVHNYVGPGSYRADPGSGTVTFTTPVSTTTSGSGAHGHNCNITLDGAHAHAISIANSTFHLHAIAEQPAHAHTFTTASNGAHTHTFTTGATGGGEAHANIQPTLLVSFYVKL